MTDVNVTPAIPAVYLTEEDIEFEGELGAEAYFITEKKIKYYNLEMRIDEQAKRYGK